MCSWFAERKRDENESGSVCGMHDDQWMQEQDADQSIKKKKKGYVKKKKKGGNARVAEVRNAGVARTVHELNFCARRSTTNPDE